MMREWILVEDSGPGVSRPRLAIVEDDLAVVSLLCEIFDEESWVAQPCTRSDICRCLAAATKCRAPDDDAHDGDIESHLNIPNRQAVGAKR